MNRKEIFGTLIITVGIVTAILIVVAFADEMTTILKGEPGVEGPAGLTGPSGPTGATGLSGYSGPSGPQGIDGASGPSGPQGNQGNTGPSGVKGPSGPTGVQGNQGNSGLTGYHGSTGPTGPPGPAGDLSSFNGDLVNESYPASGGTAIWVTTGSCPSGEIVSCSCGRSISTGLGIIISGYKIHTDGNYCECFLRNPYGDLDVAEKINEKGPNQYVYAWPVCIEAD